MRYLTFTQLRAKLAGRARSSIQLDVEAGRLPAPIKLRGRLYQCEPDVDERLRSVSSAAAKATPSSGSAVSGMAPDDPEPERDTSWSRRSERGSLKAELGTRRARRPLPSREDAK